MINFKKLLQELRDTEESLKESFMRFFSMKYLIIAVAHFLFTFYSDNIVFEYENVNLFFIVRTKIIFFIILVLIWHFIGYIARNYLKSYETRTFIKFSGIYFFIMLIFQFALWPFIVGNQMYYGYLTDSIHLTNTAVFQAIFIRYFRIYALMLIPHIAGIIIVQLIIISLIIGFVMQRIKNYFKLNKSIYLFYVPFLSPLIIQHNLHMEKDIIYGYCLFFLIALLLFMELNKPPERLNKKLVLIAFLSAVVASIRPGGIFFFAATPFIIYFLNNKFINFQKIALFILLNIAMSFIFIPNIISTVLFDKNGESYKNVYILNNTFKILLKEAIEDDNEYIMDEFYSGTNLKPERLLSQHTVLSDGFFQVCRKEIKKNLKLYQKNY